MNYYDYMIEMTGYEPKTTFWSDFSIADRFGSAAVKDTFNRAFAEWKDNVEYVTELTMILNWKLWYWYEMDNHELAKTYNDCWSKVDGWCMDNLKDNDLSYFIRTTD